MGIGFSEVLLILVISLVILGPEKMPVYGKKLGKVINTLKGYTDKLTEEINENVAEPLEEIKKSLNKATEPLTNITEGISQPMEDIKNSINDIGNPKNNVKVEEASSFVEPLVSIGEQTEAVSK